MLTPPFSFDDIMAPIGAERFFAEYEGKKPLHLEGAADKFAQLMSWAELSELLSQVTIWSQLSLQLVLDKEPVPARLYCAPAQDRGGGGQVLRPDPDKVKDIIRRGGTLVANDMDHLSSALTAFSDALGRALGAKVQGNLYMSSRRRQGFDSHFDMHDVYAVHLEGTKTWRVYEGRAPAPIQHPRYKSYGQEHHERAKGKVMMEAHMTPGDLLYLPRGWYHDALADEGGAVHIAFGAVYMVGLDVVSMLFDRMMAEVEFRTDLPRPDLDGGGALAAHLAALGDDLAAVLKRPETVARIQALQRDFPYPRYHYDLEALLSEESRLVEAAGRFRVRANGVHMVQRDGRYGLVKEGSRRVTEVPTEVSAMVGWVLERPEFTRGELVDAFPDRGAAQLDKLLADLQAMRLAVPV